MPSSDFGLPLENTGLRGSKQLSQPRRRLALTLPGYDWLSAASQSNMVSSGPKNILLKPSWEKGSPVKTTNSILANDLKLSSQSMLSSTSNSLLTAGSSLTSLDTKLSLFTSSSDLLGSSLTSTTLLTSNHCLTPDFACSAFPSNFSFCHKTTVSSLSTLHSDVTVNLISSLNTKVETSNLSLPPKHAATSVSTWTSDVPVTLTSSLTTTVEPSNLTLLSPNSIVLPTVKLHCHIDPSKSIITESTVSHSLASNLQSASVVVQEKEFEVQEDMMLQDNVSSTKSQEPQSGEMTTSLVELTLENCPPQLTQPADTASATQEKRQIVEKASDTLDSRKEMLLKQKKMALVSAVCCSLVNSPNFSNSTDLTRADIQSLCTEIADSDPEFVLKVALYTRQELNIRSTANFLLALSALLPACRLHLRRYLCPSVQLPSDWMEVPRLYQSLAGNGEKLAPLPSCLRRALTLKFQEFSEYQLAKYNTRTQRGKHTSQKKREKKVRVSRNVRFGRNIRALGSSLKLLQCQFDSPTPAATTGKKSKDRFSMKSLIQRLHISKPANHVMSLLGCRYPKDLRSFSHSGLEGPWQSHLSGQRMKLKQPETWERELSQKGNIAPVWEGLLDNHKVPFMALLRNLRNVIRAGISERHHREVNARLSSQSAVVKSRLFPFRFLSAYKVIQDLESQRQKAEKPFPSNADLLRRIFRRQSKNIPQLARHRFSRCQLRACLAVSAVHQLLKREKEALRKARAIKLDVNILERYKESLEAAIKISARHNIPPIPGRTVILICVDTSMYTPCHGAKELAICTDSDNGGRREPPSLLDVGLLLSLMVRDTSESAQLVLYNNHTFALADHSSSPLMQRVGEIKRQAEGMQDSTTLPFEDRNPLAEYLSEPLMKRTKVDTLLVFGACRLDEEFQAVLKHYRRAVNAECLCVTVLPHGFRSEDSFEQCNDVTLCGFTEQVLKYVSERGTARLLDHVEKVNERFNVPEDPESVKRRHAIVGGLLTPIPKQRWRSVRVFISSTFRDMHSERDLLIGQVMPQLRLRAACHFLSLEEVDLRWGITEEESKKDRQLSLCLSEVVRSQIFIGMLGERYGHVPKTYSVPLLPEYQWIDTYPAGRSITELEAMQFLQSCSTNTPGHPKAFFYFRDPEVLRSVPSHWISDFAAESQAAEKHILNLKNRVSKHPAARSYQYSCQWGGEHDGKPCLTALEDFGARVLEDIWQVIERDFIKERSNAPEDDDQLAQEGFQEWHERNSFARNKVVMNMCAQILEKRRTSSRNGRLFLVVGEPSQGKTVFMANLVKELRLIASSSVIYHFTGATARAKEAETMLTSFCKQLSQRLQRESSNITSYRALLAEFQALLLLTSRSLKRSDALTLFIDGADVLCGHAGELTSDWIPEFLPQRVNLVLSMTEGSSLCCSLSKHQDIVLIPLGRLEPRERVELVRGKLAVYGKKLEESAFNNQMRLLMIKKGTRDPLYLTMACEELRANAVFEKLSDDIQKLPATLSLLIQKRLVSLEEEHGTTNVTIALTAICISQKGLWERDLLRILSTLQETKSVYTATWDEMLTAASHADNLPMATFSLLLRGLRSVLGLWSPNLTSEPRLHLSSCLLREAVEKRYFVKPEVVRSGHLLMAAHFWTVSSPEDPDSSPVLHAECLSELSHHLLCGMQLPVLGQLLTHLPFLRAHAILGLLPHLCQVYSSYAMAMPEKTSLTSASWEHKEVNQQASEPPLRVFREFIQRSLHILSQNPSLFYQLALNEPECSPVCSQAQEILADWESTEPQLITAWNNKPDSINVCSSKSLDVPSVPGCVDLSSKGDLAVVGTSDGSMHILHTDSGEEVQTLHTGCDGVSACAFISDALLCVGSYDGILEIWNISDGCRIHRTEAHKRQVTGCCVSADHKQLLTCSLDFELKLWDTSRFSVLGSHSFSSPLNCAAYHPRGHVVAVGSWDAKISVIRLDNWKISAVLCCSSAVRTMSFSLDGNVVVSGSIDGWVSLWLWEAQVLLSRFRAHSGSTLTANFLRHGEYLLTGGEDGKVQVSSGGLGKLRGQACVKTASSPALSLAVSPNRQLLAVGYHSDSVCVYSVDNGDLVSQCSFADVAVGSLVWLSEVKLVTASSDSLIRVWNISKGQSVCLLTLSGHQRPVQALALSSQLLASASEDVSICLWSLESLMAVQSVSPVSVLRGHTAAITCCAFSPDGRLLATGGQDRSVLCWDVSLNPPVLAHTLLSCHKDWVTGCSWTDGGMLVSSSGDGSVCLWDIQNGKQFLTFAGHQSAVSSVLSMGERVITTGRDGCLKVWSLTGLEIASIPTHHNQINQSAAFWEPGDSRDDADLVVYTAGSDATVLKWSPLQMEQIQTLCGHGGAVTSSAADPQHEITVTAAHDGSVRLWGAPCRDERLAGIRHMGAVSTVVWSPDGELLVSGGEFGDLIVWKQEKPVLTLQCGELCISSIVFTSQRSFCSVSNDLTISRWLLFPCKGGSLRGKKAYSVEIGSLVVSAALNSSQQVQLLTLSGKAFVLDPKSGSLQDVNLAYVSRPDPDFHPPAEQLHPGNIITASQPNFGVCDSTGALWLKTSQRSDQSAADKWERTQIHSASITCLNVTDHFVTTASIDRSVKIWKCNPFRQVGVFNCEGAVTCLSPSPTAQSDNSSVVCQIACGDQYGNVYLLTCLMA